MSNFCKYCKKNDHNIDNCKEIICKSCNKRGHPYWKCSNLSGVAKPKPKKLPNVQQQTSNDKFTTVNRKNVVNDDGKYITDLEQVDIYKNKVWGDIC